MAVFRVEKNRNYTVMSNYHLRDQSLSLKAKGLMSMILSLPEGWHYSTRGMLQDTRHCSRDRQEEMLRKEGHSIVPCGASQRSLKVENYKDHLFDFDSLSESESGEYGDGQ